MLYFNKLFIPYQIPGNWYKPTGHIPARFEINK